jgi:hypothetical protein
MESSGGVNRDHNKSVPAKFAFASFHLLIIATCIWLAFGPIDRPNPMRTGLLALCAILYWARHCVTLFVLLKRKVSYSEVYGLTGFFSIFEIGFT